MTYERRKKMSMYDDVRDILRSKNVRELTKQSQFRDLVYSNKEMLREVLSSTAERDWGFVAGKYLLEQTSMSVFRKDRNDVRHSFRRMISEMMKHPADTSTIDFSVCTKKRVAMKRIDTHEQMINNLQSQFEMNCDEIKQLETDNKEIKVALRALSNLRK